MNKSSVFLLIPTLDKRDMIRETLDSVKDKASLFDKLIISVNGLTPNRIRLLVANNGLSDACETHIFCTGKSLTFVNHFKFIQNNLKKLACINTLIYFLADDDLIASKSDNHDYLNTVTHETCGLCIGMGNLQTFSQKSENLHDEKQLVKPGEKLPPLTFLLKDYNGGGYTNISSMMIPFIVFSDATSFMQLFGSAGRRAEYIWATHKQVAYLYSPPRPTALIRDHPLQIGKTLSHVSGLQDELIYFLWVWLNQPATRPWAKDSLNYGFTIRSFLKLLKQFIRTKYSFPLLLK